jgi:hypothetical protein
MRVSKGLGAELNKIIMITNEYKLLITIHDLIHKHYQSGLTPTCSYRYEARNNFSGDQIILYKPSKS